jgi:hypothetical protein
MVTVLLNIGVRLFMSGKYEVEQQGGWRCGFNIGNKFVRKKRMEEIKMY